MHKMLLVKPVQPLYDGMTQLMVNYQMLGFLFYNHYMQLLFPPSPSDIALIGTKVPLHP